MWTETISVNLQWTARVLSMTLTSEPCVCRACCCRSRPSREGGYKKRMLPLWTLTSSCCSFTWDAGVWIFLPLLPFHTSKHARPSFECLFSKNYKTLVRMPLVLNWRLNVAPHLFLLVGKRNNISAAGAAAHCTLTVCLLSKRNRW